MSLHLQHNDSLALAAQFTHETSQAQLARYFVVAALAAVVWQLALGIAEDFKILQREVSTSSILYFISRHAKAWTSVLGLVILATSTSFNIGSNALCARLVFMQSWLFTTAICSTSFLFFFRTRAVFMGDRNTTALFLVLWLSVLGSCAYMPFTVSVSPDLSVPAFESLPLSKIPVGMCTVSTMDVECVTCIAMVAVYDTAIFVGVVWRLLSFVAAGEGFCAWMEYLYGRKTLPVISGMLLRGTQKYYAVAICVHIAAGTFMHVPGISRAVVFRDMRIGLSEQSFDSSATAFSALEFENAEPFPTTPR
ncbi:hypothetical protein EW145_g5427 [Phellinidium pouzarii]|uniref:Transmembrane protein n=1 Tax=Phellinidium pouzarii TaxID=167371 RepID=A0A4S4L1W2_9AGAM|nr:hypothetical protein EW145_g5427 [Phellinidium pouzarii]